MSSHPGKRASMLADMSSVTMDADITSPAIEMKDVRSIACVYLKWTGASADGALTVEANNDPSDNPSASTWETVTGTSVAVAGAGSHMYNIANCGFPWIRLKFAFSSGTGTITVANYTVKGA